MIRRTRPVLFLLFALFLIPLAAHAFSFSEYENQEKNVEQSSAPLTTDELKCTKSLHSKKIATMIGEIHRNQWTGRYGYFGYFTAPGDPDWDARFGTRKPVYGDLAADLNREFSRLGLKTYTAEQINDQIAREEQEAFLNNDQDAALSAAERLSADFVLKGLISTRTQVNKVVNVDEVFVTIDLVLMDRNGGTLASAQVSQTAFSDADIQAALQKMVRKQAVNITRELFKDYCGGGN